MIQKLAHGVFGFATLFTAGLQPVAAATNLNLADRPLFISASVPPLNMLIMGRDHKMFYEAYNDASDLNGDGIVDTGYQGYHGNTSRNVDYYGYFNSYACYDYDASLQRYVPKYVKSAAERDAKNKTCNTVAGDWSGDFLNYVTTARIDALRKVLYGGFRSIDTAALTVLERTHIPQDAHAWGKEYDPITAGFQISHYTPLPTPVAGRRHLFANVSLSNDGAPLMRVLDNSTHRVWEWLSKERPVAGNKCINGLNGPEVDCAKSGFIEAYTVVPASAFTGLTRKIYRLPNNRPDHPSNNADFIKWEEDYAKANRLDGTDSPLQIDGSGNPFGNSDNYMTIFTGKIKIPFAGNWSFAVDGDDAVEVTIDGKVVAGWYGGHGACNCQNATNTGSILLGAGEYTIKFRHEDKTGGDSYRLSWGTPAAASVMTDYQVRAEVCKANVPSAGSITAISDDNCSVYNTSRKPTGILHEFGENDSMMFGLLTGTYRKNLDGGVLRKKISSFRNEVNFADGTFLNTVPVGIVKTIDKFKTVNFNYSDKTNGPSVSGGACGFSIINRALNVGECEMWGNPIAEMMYESLRYFSGKGTPTTDFMIPASGVSDSVLGLPLASWNDPYAAVGGANYCAKPFQMVISDTNVSYDSDKVPGSAFSTFSGDISGLSATTMADEITAHEGSSVTGMRYIGESRTLNAAGATVTLADKAPTPKKVESLAKIRGLAPEEPTKLGSYYAASMAYYGRKTDLRSDLNGKQQLETFSVALASPLPRIDIKVANGKKITIVPFAKSVGGSSINAAQGEFQPTNQIVDFYIESLTDTSGVFLINYEDIEQGADHDMDAIARYSYQYNAASDTVTVTVTSEYAAGGIDQHMGYVISGTSADGIYLEVKDRGGADVNYWLDTPAARTSPSAPRGTALLGFSNTRVFSPGATTGAGVLKDPLWYAAKWGGFTDANNNGKPDEGEWEEKGVSVNPNPANYFLVTNALNLSTQLRAAFNQILTKNGASAAAAVNSGTLTADTLLFRALFNAEDWSGQLEAVSLLKGGAIGNVDWRAQDKLAALLGQTGGHNNRQIITYKPAANIVDGRGIPFRWPASYSAPTANEMSTAQTSRLLGAVASGQQSYGSDLVTYLRGAKTQESKTAGNTRNFRSRNSMLGDIVNSDPLYITRPASFFPATWPAGSVETSYSSFRTEMKDRQPMLAVGANDGMLHIFDASPTKTEANPTVVNAAAGKELLAYVPAAVYRNLSDLASPSYSHRYFVDGQQTHSDVFFGGKWHTALVGGLGAGGQAIYALDITDPTGTVRTDNRFHESKADTLSLWEFSDANHIDMGYTIGRPAIARMANGKWAAIFGNGYNNTEADGRVSTSGNAVLYIVDIETGELIRVFDTGRGVDDDPAGRPNGMASPRLVDEDNDFILDFIYAGDLQGNMWKIDVRGASANSWHFDLKAGSDPKPVFVATDNAGNRLPITTRPFVAGHPDAVARANGDSMIFFGTGKYIEPSDNTGLSQKTQAFFGIWDDGSGTATRADLLLQNITEEQYITVNADGKLVDDNDPDGGFTGRPVRTSTDHPIRWKDEVAADGSTLVKHRGWVLDLYSTEDGNTNNFGERQVYDSSIRTDRLLFNTIIPSSDPCAFGGKGWPMQVDPVNGGQLDFVPVDLNGDGLFDDKDLLDTDGDGVGDSQATGFGTDPANGNGLGEGFPSNPAIVLDNGKEYQAYQTSDGGINNLLGNPNLKTEVRHMWREVNQ